MSGRRMAGTALAVVASSPVLASESASEATHAADGSALITPEIGLIFWTVVTFVILLFLLKRFAWSPILAAMNSREEGIQSDLDRARREREEAQRILEEHRTLLTQARKERADAVEAGRRDAERVKAEMLEEARKQRDSLVLQAEGQIAASVRQARLELKGVAADLAIQAAGKLLGKNLDDAGQKRLVEEYIADLERMGSASRTN